MMNLKFSIDDILKDGRKDSESRGSTPSSDGFKLAGQRPATSDGESTRSESPNSNASINSDDIHQYEHRGGRRIRTVIQNWQKLSLEAAFQQQKYPTVHYLAKLSKELGLPHYVTKVWFQNRRSKFRKEGNRAQSRRNSAPYPLNTNAKRNEELDETKAGHDGYLLDPPAVVPTQPCNCIECTGIDGGDMAEEQQMPVLSPHRQVCKCEECARDPVAQQLQRIQQQQQQHQQRQQQRDWVQIKPDQRQQPEQYRLLKFCDCANCVIELQKSRKMQTEQTLKRAQILEEQQRLESQVVPIQRLKPGIDDNHIRREGRDTPNTLHYEADPYAVNHRKMSNRRSKGQCSCSQCRIDITNFRYY